MSLKSLLLYLILSLSRLSSILFSDAYLPYDRSGDWIYRGTECLGFVFLLLLVFAYRSFGSTYYSYTVRELTG